MECAIIKKEKEKEKGEEKNDWHLSNNKQIEWQILCGAINPLWQTT